MASYWLAVALMRLVLPGIFAACAIWRPAGLSLVYLALTIYSPIVPIPTGETMRGHTGYFLKACIGLSFLTTLTQLTFHIVLVSMPPYGHFLENCESVEIILRNIGLVKLDHASVWEVLYWLLPEIIILPAVAFTYHLCRRATGRHDHEIDSLSQRNQQKAEERLAKIINILGQAGNYVVLILLCTTSVLNPSVQCGLYFLTFIGAATWWSLNRDFGKKFSVICRGIMVIVLVHLFAVLAYQNQWFQDSLPPNAAWARYFGMVKIYNATCIEPVDDPRDVDIANEADWFPYGYTIRLICLYYVLALQSRYLARKPNRPEDIWRKPPTERTPLMKFGSGRSGLLQDSTGSVIVQDGQQDDNIQMQSLTEDKTQGVWEQVMLAFYSIYQLVVGASYLASNIMMMTWSIMYHSWATFALLLWALLLWMVPNKRVSMTKCIPFIVLYCTLLITVQFIYSLDLTEDELPTIINGIKMAEIGFIRTTPDERYHLIVKCIFTTMFWVTMRQYTAEKSQQRRSSTLRDMVAPLHVSVTTATAAMGQEQPVSSKFTYDVGSILERLLTKFWIVVVAIMLFTSGITGDRMTVFRIMYMMLFLVFVTTFQVSWYVWRKMMYPFWIAVIAYSVIMLILVYTYQFPKFPGYWESILKVNTKLQIDIGLEVYETKDLFVRLLTPTFFVIITVLQMHYFHDNFLKMTDLDQHSQKYASIAGETAETVLPEDQDSTVVDMGKTRRKPIKSLKQLKQMSKVERIAMAKGILSHIASFYNYFWIYLELHIQKIIFISFILLCINDVCAINFCLLLVVVIVINFKRSLQIISIKILTLVIGFLMLTKMLYQITYIDHNHWSVNCTRENPYKFEKPTSTFNMAEWIGMNKAEPEMLPRLLKGYIGIITVTTLGAIIDIRQKFYRAMLRQPLEMPTVMFPDVKRMDADSGIVPFMKFLFSYGFYKFGIEMTLIAVVILIGVRLDFYSILYSIWLTGLFALNRKTSARAWPVFQIFGIVMLPFQYACAMAPPTWLCIRYVWGQTEIYRRLQEWMYLPDPDFPPNARKLIYDFLVLMMIVRQSAVFRIEAHYDTRPDEFAAGHNYSVFHENEKPNFINPIKDFVTHIHSWLDIAKRGTLMSLMWITLAIMFLAGTQRTNLFSLGYLIGSFIFLWQGSDLYLRPIKTILRWWNMLTGYTVVVIMCKSLLQCVGCVFKQDLEQSACWLIRLLGIACLKKFQTTSPGDMTSTLCTVPREDIGMVWDGLGFAFLILQKRLFKSYYFFHIVDETKAMSILASRGAELLEELHEKRIVSQEKIEKAVLGKLKLKMDKIKENQRKIQGPTYREPADHKAAIRSGDYYMFDDLEDDDHIVLEEAVDSDEELQKAEVDPQRRMTVGELMTTLLKTDIEVATHVALHGGTAEDALRIRRQSEPATRKKSSMSYTSAHSDSDTAGATDVPDQLSADSGEVDGKESERGSPKRDSIGEESTKGDKKTSLLTYFKFVIAMFNSMMTSMTKYLNRFSRDYRYIRKVLAKEKKKLKEKPDFRLGMRLGVNQIWQPIPLLKRSGRYSAYGSSEGPLDPGEGPSNGTRRDRKETSLTIPHIRILAPSLERGLDKSSSSTILTKSGLTPHGEEEMELSEVDQPPIIQLAASIWFGILAHSTLLCYFLVFLHQIKNASVLSLPLPMMVFLWGSLTIPRPSKTFWVTLIAYTEIIVIIKCLFQLELIPWNQKVPPKDPLFIPRIMGIERKQNYALWDLLLLLMVFFHRFMLKSLGQWTNPPVRPRKIIPSKLTLATITHISEKPEPRKEGTIKMHEEPTSDSVDIVTPGGRSISLVTDDTETPGITDENQQLVAVQADEINPMEESFTRSFRMSVAAYSLPIKSFFADILEPTGKERTNVYTYMFLCDFFNFLLLIFGFSSFGSQVGDGGVTAYLRENRVPMPFLMMLLVQFALIVIDRALFLRKFVLGKLVFQFLLVLYIHIWMFFLLPSTTERKFNDTIPPQIWYMVKCFYLLLAAYQLRLGYPTRILGNVMCKKYTMVNYGLFKTFMLVPFLFEGRAVMDWIWTDTSMTVMDWFKMEDIFANIYQIKCMRGLESEYPQPRGTKKGQFSKYLVGGGVLGLIIGAIWFPLLLFALGNTVGETNIPTEVSLSIKIGAFAPIYAMSAQNSTILPYTQKNFDDVKKLYNRDRTAVTFLENYQYTDVTAVILSGSSKTFWEISPPDRERLRQELLSDRIVNVFIEWSVARKTNVEQSSGIAVDSRRISLQPYINGTKNEMRIQLAQMLEIVEKRPNPATNDDTPMVPYNISLQHTFPKFLKVTSRLVAPVPQLMKIPVGPDQFDEVLRANDDYLFRNISLTLSSTESGTRQWWVIGEQCQDDLYKNLLSSIPYNDCSNIMILLFNDKIFPDSFILRFFSGIGIIGLYSGMIIFLSKFMRGALSEMAPKIMFDDMPYVDRILKLCLDVYLVRESGDLRLEEDLFAKLIFLYRSPETLIKWTRPPDPNASPDDDEINLDEHELTDREAIGHRS